MRIDSNSALTLAAFIRSALAAIDRIETHVSQFNLSNLSSAELDSLGYSLHNIYNALDNRFAQISLSFENDVRDRTRWHRELLEKMFLDIKSLRPAVLPSSFSFRAYCVNNIRAFKLLDNDDYLFYLTTYGVCLFDTCKRDIVIRTDFTKFAHQWSGFALSPAKLLAIGCSRRINNYPLFGSFRHRNFVQIYNLESGERVGEPIFLVIRRRSGALTSMRMDDN